MKKFEIVTYTNELQYTDLQRTNDVFSTFWENVGERNEVNKFDTLDEALPEFKDYTTEYSHLMGMSVKYYLIDVYALEEVEYSKDGERLSTDTLDTTELPTFDELRGE